MDWFAHLKVLETENNQKGRQDTSWTFSAMVLLKLSEQQIQNNTELLCAWNCYFAVIYDLSQ